MDNKTRVEKLGNYLQNIVEELNSSYMEINVDFLGLDVDNYSLDKVPTQSTTETWITGQRICRDVFSFRSRNPYSSSLIENLNNIGFFEKFESIIKSNNDKGILPEIEGIEKIECLNCGTFISADPSLKTAIFEIQIQITYREV